jgi:F0F1-type ATP synthase membrane subunit b/b'
MYLLNQTLNNFLIQSLDSGVKFNFDILNANLINLIILDGGLIYILSKTLTESLFERKKRILKAFEDSEEKLSRSVISFVESFLKLNQVKLVVNEIQKKTEKVIFQSRSAIYEEGKFELVRIKDSALMQLVVIGATQGEYLISLIKGLVILRTIEEFKFCFTSEIQDFFNEELISSKDLFETDVLDYIIIDKTTVNKSGSSSYLKASRFCLKTKVY